MMLERLKHFLIGGAVLAALALGGSAVAGAATGSAGSTSATTAPKGSDGGGPAAAFISAGTPGTAARGNVERAVTGRGAAKAGRLSDHEQYVRHHQRLASLA